MATPWLPSAPAWFQNFATTYKVAIPRAWPARLYEWASDSWKDLETIGESLAMVRELLEWLLDSYFPERDAQALWLSRWEASLGISVGAYVAASDRANAIIAKIRVLGKSMDEDTVKRIFAPAFGLTAPSDVTLIAVDPADISAGDTLHENTYLRNQNSLHVCSTSGSDAPDPELAQAIIDRIAPTWQEWSYGTTTEFTWGTTAWDEGTWS